MYLYIGGTLVKWDCSSSHCLQVDGYLPLVDARPSHVSTSPPTHHTNQQAFIEHLQLAGFIDAHIRFHPQEDHTLVWKNYDTTPLFQLSADRPEVQ